MSRIVIISEGRRVGFAVLGVCASESELVERIGDDAGIELREALLKRVGHAGIKARLQ